MSKYSNKFKLEVIKYYLEENHSYSECMKKFNISSNTSIKEWIKKYSEHGAEGLVKNQNTSYNGDFK